MGFVTAGGAAIGVQALSSALGIFKSFEQADILRGNAAEHERNIPLLRARGREQARQLQVGSYLTQGQQKTGYAKGGLAVAGSVFDVMADTVKNFDRDASYAILESNLAARAEQRAADLSRFQAKSGIRDAITGGVLNVAAIGTRVNLPYFGAGFGSTV